MEIRQMMKFSKKYIRFVFFVMVVLSLNSCFTGFYLNKPRHEQTGSAKEKKHHHRVFVAGHMEKNSNGRRWLRAHWEEK